MLSPLPTGVERTHLYADPLSPSNVSIYEGARANSSVIIESETPNSIAGADQQPEISLMLPTVELPLTETERALAPQQTYTASEIRRLERMYRLEYERSAALSKQVSDLRAAATRVAELEAEKASLEESFMRSMESVRTRSQQLMNATEAMRERLASVSRERDEAIQKVADLEQKLRNRSATQQNQLQDAIELTEAKARTEITRLKQGQKLAQERTALLERELSEARGQLDGALQQIEQLRASQEPQALERRLTQREQEHAAALAALRDECDRRVAAVRANSAAACDGETAAVSDALAREQAATLASTKRVRSLLSQNAALKEKCAALLLELETIKKNSRLTSFAELQQRISELEARLAKSDADAFGKLEARAMAAEAEAARKTAALQQLRREADGLVQQIAKLAMQAGADVAAFGIRQIN